MQDRTRRLVRAIGRLRGSDALRFLTGKLAHVITVSAFPWGTFAVNIIGSFVIGIFFGLEMCIRDSANAMAVSTGLYP